MIFRNLLVSPIMTHSLSEQETLFQELWCRPVESFFLGSDFTKSLETFNKILHQFSLERAESSRHVSQEDCCLNLLDYDI